MPEPSADTLAASVPAPHVGIGLSSEVKVLMLMNVGDIEVVTEPSPGETGGST